MKKVVTFFVLALIGGSAFGAPVTTLNCTVSKTKETFVMKVKLGKNTIEEIIYDSEDNLLIAEEGSDIASLAQAEDVYELNDGSQVIATDLAGIEAYKLTLTSASGFTKGILEFAVYDRVTSSNKPYKSSVSCSRK